MCEKTVCPRNNQPTNKYSQWTEETKSAGDEEKESTRRRGSANSRRVAVCSRMEKMCSTFSWLTHRGNVVLRTSVTGARREGLASTASNRRNRRGIPVDIYLLSHFVTDDVHQVFKHLLDVDVFLGAGLEELETWERAPQLISRTSLHNQEFCTNEAGLPRSSASRWPSSVGMSRSSSRSHLLPTRITWALFSEYILICVALETTCTFTEGNAHNNTQHHRTPEDPRRKTIIDLIITLYKNKDWAKAESNKN